MHSAPGGGPLPGSEWRAPRSGWSSPWPLPLGCGGGIVKVHYRPETARETYCEVCGELTLCDVLAADSRESETGYLDKLALCPECRRELEAHR